MSRYPARCRQRPAWRTALATERWIEGRVSVPVRWFFCPV